MDNHQKKGVPRKEHPSNVANSTILDGSHSSATQNYQQLFCEAMTSQGIQPPADFIADGRMHRFSTNGKNGDRAGWYILHLNGLPAGSFGNWRDGADAYKWCAKPDNQLSKAERTELAKRHQQQRQEAERQRELDYKTAAKSALTDWQTAKPAPSNHSYLVKKQIKPHLARVLDGNLVLPLFDENGDLWSVQKIGADGEKRFASGGKTAGMFCVVGTADGKLPADMTDQTILICEGFSTGATLHETIGLAVVVAFSAPNLPKVAAALFAKHPRIRFLMCGDDDHAKPANIGKTKATEAASTIGARVVFPSFEGAERGDGDSDFNDMARVCGLDKVRQAIDQALQSEPIAPAQASAQRLFEVLETPAENEAAGVYYTGNDNGHRQWIASPLLIEAVTSDAHGNNFGRLLRFQNSLGNWRTWAMPMEWLRADCADLRGALLGMGVTISPNKGARSLFSNYLQHHLPERQVTCTAQTGWLNGVFVLPNQTIGDNADSVIYQANSPSNGEYSNNGSLSDWRASIATQASGNAILTLAISAAFAGGLLGKVGMEGGGFHLTGNSSTGKTTALTAAASVWGGENFRKTWRATSNGLEAVATLSNDGLLILDEIGECLPREIGNITYMLANGRPKSRMTKQITARQVQSWRCIALSSGEKTLYEAMQEGGLNTKDGQEIRMLNINADFEHGAFQNLHGAANGADFSDRLKSAAIKNYGTAGVAFLEKLTRDGRNFVADLALMESKFNTINADGLVKRSAKRFSVVALAGELASEYGITGWRAGDATAACLELFNLWLAEFGKNGTARSKVASKVLDFITENEGGFTERYDTETRVIKRLGWWTEANGGRVYYLTTKAMCTALAGESERDGKRILIEQGALVGGKDGKSSTVVAGLGRCYSVNMSKLQAEITPNNTFKNEGVMAANQQRRGDNTYYTYNTEKNGGVLRVSESPIEGEV